MEYHYNVVLYTLHTHMNGMCLRKNQCNSFTVRTLYVDCNWINCVHRKCSISIFTFNDGQRKQHCYPTKFLHSYPNWFVASKHTIYKQQSVRMQILKDFEIGIDGEIGDEKNDKK